MAEWKKSRNPLLNELVIDNIAKYLSFEELKVCRGLNHLWKKTTNKLFLKQCPYICLLDSQSYKFIACSNIYTNLHMKIAQFMEIYSDPNHPHPQAQLLRQYCNFDVFQIEEAECIPIFYNFMTQVGPQMRSLKLINVNVLRNLQDLADIVSSKYSPKLEELLVKNLKQIKNYQQSNSETVGIKGKENKHLRILSISKAHNDHYKKIQWLDVLSLYPKLKDLSINKIDADSFEEIATALVTIRKANETKLKLTELKITEIKRPWDTEAERKAGWQRIGYQLKTANLPLEKLALDESTIEISSALIQHYEESLKSLILKDSIPKPFPLMKAVEKMIVIKCCDFTFLTKVPNLKSLDFYPHSLEICFPESTPNPLPSLTNFKCGAWKYWSVTEMEQLLMWMPNITDLEIRLNNNTFPFICQHLPNLKTLTVRGEDLDDSGVVGYFDEALEVEGCRANITNLKELETFEMTDVSVSGYNKKRLTEKSVFHGFSLMTKLSKLTFKVKSELSADAMLALNRGIKNVRVSVVSVFDLSI